MSSPPDLKQLSARLGLSPTTVSRALNGYSDVSEATRRRVIAMASELGYQPHSGARRLALGRTDAVGIVYPLEAGDLGDPRFLQVIEGLSDRLEAAGRDLLLVSAHEKSELATYERLVRGRRVDGLIVARTRVHDSRIDYLRECGLPFVAYGRSADPRPYAWFDFDNQRGTEIAVERLAALGHRRIAYLHAPLNLNFAQQRHQGFVQAMAAARIAVVPEWVIAGGMSRRAGYAAAQRLLALLARPTAVIVDNNLCGVGVVRALIDDGLTLGSAISVIVYDGVPEDHLLRGQRVASIDQPTQQEAGTTMAEMLLALIEGKVPEQSQVLRQPVFLGGDSIGPAPAA